MINRRQFFISAVLISLLTNLPLPLYAAEVRKIGVIGTGSMGKPIGTLFVRAGYEVKFSSRHPEELKSFADGLGPKASVGTVRQAATFGDVIVLTVPYGAYPQVGRDFARYMKGKIILDAGNAIESRDGDIVPEVLKRGVGKSTQMYFPGTKIVRAFNTLPYFTILREAHRSGEKVGIPLASDYPGAMETAAKLIRDIGFEPVIVGDLEASRAFEYGSGVASQALPAGELRKRLGVE